MYKLLITVGAVLILFSGFAIYRTLAVPSVSNDKIEISTMVENLNYEMNMKKEGIETNKVSQQLEERYSKPESAIEYLFALSMLEKQDLYPDAFTLEQYSKDAFDTEATDREGLIIDIMNRLTRNKNLESVEYVKNMMVFEQDSIRLVVDLRYKDLSEPIRVNVKLKKVKHLITSTNEPDFEYETNYYYIDSSVWELIDRIEDNI